MTTKITKEIKPICIRCNKTPSELDEYDPDFTEDPNPDHYVKENEGTYNPKNGHFLCIDCYIKAGMPSSPKGWIAP